MRLLVIMAFTSLSACAPHPPRRALSSSETTWLGCYRIRVDSSASAGFESVRLVSRGESTPGGWAVIPNREVSPDNGDAGARRWHQEKDSLVIEEGMLGTLRITLGGSDSALSGFAALRSDVIECTKALAQCKDPYAKDWPVAALRVRCDQAS